MTYKDTNEFSPFTVRGASCQYRALRGPERIHFPRCLPREQHQAIIQDALRWERQIGKWQHKRLNLIRWVSLTKKLQGWTEDHPRIKQARKKITLLAQKIRQRDPKMPLRSKKQTRKEDFFKGRRVTHAREKRIRN
jgi:hypothetical protein